MATEALVLFCGGLSLAASLASVFPGWLIVGVALRLRSWPAAVGRSR